MSINGVLQGSYRYDFAGRQAIRTIAATGALIREYVWLGWGVARPDGLPVCSVPHG